MSRRIRLGLGLEPGGTTFWNSPESHRAPAATGRPVSIGKYLVVGALDAGGQAEVYRVGHEKLGKDLVLKWSHKPCTEGERNALEAEGRLLAEFEHPDLVRVYDLDFHDNRPFLVMEFVRGPNLQQQVERQRVTPRQAAALVARIARVVALAHRRGVVHHDIKPKNIMIDESGRPRLIDFGMARLHNTWSDDPTRPAAARWPTWRPEQAAAKREQVGPAPTSSRAGGGALLPPDGHAPFEGKTRAAVWDRASRCDFDRAALRSRGVPRRLANICLKAMAAEPEDRPATADDLAAVLEQFVRRPSRSRSRRRGGPWWRWRQSAPGR